MKVFSNQSRKKSSLKNCLNDDDPPLNTKFKKSKLKTKDEETKLFDKIMHKLKEHPGELFELIYLLDKGHEKINNRNTKIGIK